MIPICFHRHITRWSKADKGGEYEKLFFTSHGSKKKNLKNLFPTVWDVARQLRTIPVLNNIINYENLKLFTSRLNYFVTIEKT